jgi:hypothetical protein
MLKMKKIRLFNGTKKLSKLIPATIKPITILETFIRIGNNPKLPSSTTRKHHR